MRKTLEDVLVEEHLLDDPALRRARMTARRQGLALVTYLHDTQAIPDDVLARALEKHLHQEVVDLSREEIDEEAVREVPHDLARSRLLLPLSVDRGEGVLRVAMADPLDLEAVEDIEISTGCRALAVLARASDVSRALGRHYRGIITKMIPRHIDPAPSGAMGEDAADQTTHPAAEIALAWVDSLVDQLTDRGLVDRGLLEAAVRLRLSRPPRRHGQGEGQGESEGK